MMLARILMSDVKMRGLQRTKREETLLDGRVHSQTPSDAPEIRNLCVMSTSNSATCALRLP